MKTFLTKVSIALSVLLTTTLLSGADLEEKKHYGIELNPFSIITSGLFVSGTFSYFNHENATELSIPFYMIDDNPDKSIIIDLSYRKYFNDKIGGAYLGSFIRYANLDGELIQTDSINNRHQRAKQSKIGAGVTIGFKTYGMSGFMKNFYWGASFSGGGYISGDNEIYNSMFINDSPFILDIEFFKIGYSF
jgi:hypothetical protein